MGSYCELHIKHINVYGTKNRINNNHLCLFSPNEVIDSIVEEDGEFRRQIIARTTAFKAKRRLQILGYSLEKAKAYFEDGVKYQKSKYCSDSLEENEELYTSERQYYLSIDFENYIAALRTVFSSDIKLYMDDIFVKYPYIEQNYLSKHIVEKLNSGYYFSHTIYDEIWEDEEELINELLDIYICLICVDDADMVELDLTDVIESGWVGIEKIFGFYENDIDRTIIITEGKTDIDVLARSIKILYPEYGHLYSFFDFDTYRADGGASYLVKLLKSFSAAKIKNRVIAVFDNDSAAINELQQLEQISLLSTINVIKLPELEFCKSYPTIGPGGLSYLDINELAVGIEMFFGEDILKNNGEYYPIIWNGYISRINKYQGLISEKDRINQQMKNKLSNPQKAEHDWEPLKKLWEYLFKV